MRFYKKVLLTGLCLLTTTAFAGSQDHQIKLHVNADNQEAQKYVKKICITTNYGLTKNCGDGAVRKHSSDNKKIIIVSNHFKPLGFDESCRDYRFGWTSPEGKGVLDLYTTVRIDMVNGIKVVSVSNCSRVWTPAN